MIVYAHIDNHFYEVHINMDHGVIAFILRYRDGQEQRPTRCSWDDLSQHESDIILPKVRKAVRSYDKNNPQ